MLIINDETMLAASILPAALKALLLQRAEQLAGHEGYNLSDLATFLIVQTDSYADVEGALAYPLQSDGQPHWEWIARHDGWFEAPFIFSDDGYGWIVFIEDSDTTDADLLALCRQHMS